MNYQEFRLELAKLADDDYCDFAKAGTPTDYPFLGVRLPYLRDFAKKIVKSDSYKDFLVQAPQSFEEITTQGIVIASLPYEEMLGYFTNYVKKIDNWGTCDTFCNTLKPVRKHRKEFLPYIDKLLDGGEFEVRVALVILLSHYLNEKDVQLEVPESVILAAGWPPESEAPVKTGGRTGSRELLTDIVFNCINRVKGREEYYIKMAIAWLVAECFIKYPDATWDYLASDTLPKWTQNKAISKIRDSYRVDQVVKDALITLRK